MTVPTTCCGKSGEACVCAAQAKCSCGKQSALSCTCEKANTENTVAGARCSCRKIPPYFLYCACLEAPLASMTGLLPWFWVSTRLINVRTEILLAVGARPAGECTCDRASTENAKVTGSTCSCGARPAGKLHPVPCLSWNPTLTPRRCLQLRESH